jgi:predicted DCC family thiol-disulfide oxidoreductase YuxK
VLKVNVFETRRNPTGGFQRIHPMTIKHTSTKNEATLYYDGSCPLCMKEMAKLGRLKDERLHLADIHGIPQGTDLPDTDTLLRDLHLQLHDGRMLIGVEANVAAWQYTRHGAWFRWMLWPGISNIADLVYKRWARWRYESLYSQSCATRRRS